MQRFDCQTRGPGLYDLTARISDWLAGQGGDGVLTLFVQHTSCSLVIQENADPAVQTDLQAWITRAVPDSDDPSMAYLTHTYEGPDDMPAHIRASLLPSALTIPFAGGRMALGTWQGIYLWEHRDSPKTRHIVAQITGGRPA